MKPDIDEFNKNCGIILRSAVHIESTLEFFISNYFVSPQNYKTFLLNDSILAKEISLNQKINVFRDICNEEDVEEDRINNIINSIKFVQTKRNMVAHGQIFMESINGGFKLQKRKSYWFKKDELELTPELMQHIADETLSAVQGISKIHIELSDISRIKKTKIIG
jgi:hypothetical protein